MTKWTHRYIMIVPAGQQANANTKFAQLTRNTADQFTFSFPLVPANQGQGPATHLACFTSLTEQIKLEIEDLVGVAGMEWWRLDLEGILKDTNTSSIIEETLTFDEALVEAGLEREPANV